MGIVSWSRSGAEQTKRWKIGMNCLNVLSFINTITFEVCEVSCMVYWYFWVIGLHYQNTDVGIVVAITLAGMKIVTKRVTMAVAKLMWRDWCLQQSKYFTHMMNCRGVRSSVHCFLWMCLPMSIFKNLYLLTFNIYAACLFLSELFRLVPGRWLFRYLNFPSIIAVVTLKFSIL